MRDMRKILKAMHSQKGFTLIELLVVVGILAVLAGVVTLGVTQFIGRGGEEAACTDLHNVQTAAAACRVEVASGTPGADAADCVDQDTLRSAGYLLTESKCTYTIDSDGVVTAQDCGTASVCPRGPSGTT